MNKPSLSAPIHSRTTLLLEVHDRHDPLLHRSPRRRPSRVPTSVRGAQCGPQHDRVPGHDQLVDVEAQVGKGLAVSPHHLAPGRWPPSQGIGVGVPVQIGGGVVVAGVPDLLDEPSHLRLALGPVHGAPPFSVGGFHRVTGEARNSARRAGAASAGRLSVAVSARRSSPGPRCLGAGAVPVSAPRRCRRGLPRAPRRSGGSPGPVAPTPARGAARAPVPMRRFARQDTGLGHASAPSGASGRRFAAEIRG